MLLLKKAICAKKEKSANISAGWKGFIACQKQGVSVKTRFLKQSSTQFDAKEEKVKMSYQVNICLEKNESGYLASCPEISEQRFQSQSLDTVFDDLKKAIGRDLEIKENSTPKVRQPLWKIAQLLIADMTEEELERLPTDGAQQHDNYIYGTPKQEG